MGDCCTCGKLTTVSLANNLPNLIYTNKACDYSLGKDRNETEPDVATSELHKRHFRVDALDTNPHELIALQNSSTLSLEQQDETHWKEKLYDKLQKVLTIEKNTVLIQNIFGVFIVSEILKTFFCFIYDIGRDQMTTNQWVENISGKIPFPKSRNWRICRILVCDQLPPGSSPCKECQSKIVIGDGIKEWWLKIKKVIPLERDLTTYQLSLKFILYTEFREEISCITKSDRPTYIFLSNHQYLCLHDRGFKLVAVSSKSGTGKSTLITAKMKQCLKRNEKVLFVTFTEERTKTISLLMRPLEKAFEIFEGNFSTLPVPYDTPCLRNDLLKLIDTYPNHHIFMDDVVFGENRIQASILFEIAERLSEKGLFFWFTSGANFSDGVNNIRDLNNLHKKFKVVSLPDQFRYTKNLQKVHNRIKNDSKSSHCRRALGKIWKKPRRYWIYAGFVILFVVLVIVLAVQFSGNVEVSHDKFKTYDVTEPGSTDSIKIKVLLLNETSYEQFAQQCKDLGGHPFIPRNEKEEELRLELISSNRGGQSVWIHGPGCPSDTDCPNSDPENDNDLCMFLDDGTPPRRPGRTNCDEHHLGICVKRNL